MTAERHYSVSEAFAESTHIDADRYADWYRQSIESPDEFWAEQAASHLEWFRTWDTVSDCDFTSGKISWFQGARLNASYNCLDRHLEQRGERTALIWESDDDREARRISYNELHESVCRLANALKGIGVKRGQVVCLYMPMIPEIAIAMLACARIGAPHMVVFDGYSPNELREQIDAVECTVVLTASYGHRAGRTIGLKRNVDRALEDDECSVKRVVVVRRDQTDNDDQKLNWVDGRDLWYQDLVQGAASQCSAAEVDADEPLFVLNTSGTATQTQSVVHATGGYLLYAAMTFRHVFDHQDNDVHWCPANAGWITGHTYGLYGPLACGATTVMYEGVMTYPDAARYWDIIDTHQVNTFYTVPTAIRNLRAQGPESLANASLKSLRLIASVGEPINPASWMWLYEEVGRTECPVLDTWWQTETGGILLSPLAGAMPLAPDTVGQPYFGVQPVLLDAEGQRLEGEAEGHLVFAASWPGQAVGLHNNLALFRERYFERFAGYYASGDIAHRDANGNFRILGRADDRIDIRGDHIGSATIENLLVDQPEVEEAGVVSYVNAAGYPAIWAFLNLREGVEGSDALCHRLREVLRSELGDSAVPETIQWVPGLPKTRSGKVLRRILRKVAENDVTDLGDLSTLVDAAVVDKLLELR